MIKYTQCIKRIIRLPLSKNQSIKCNDCGSLISHRFRKKDGRRIGQQKEYWILRIETIDKITNLITGGTGIDITLCRKCRGYLITDLTYGR